MKLIALSIMGIKEIQSPEIMLGLVLSAVLLIVITIGFIYKRRQGKK
jgi:hypothetical protein